MIEKLSSAFAALCLFALPVSALAQSDEGDQDPSADAAAVAGTVDRRTYPPIDFDASVDPEDVWVLDLSNGERVKIRLMDEWAPSHVERIKTLTREGFYNGVIFHRVIDGFMAQGGDPTGTGQGGSELPDLEEEFNPMPHIRGTVSMARAAEEDSANSQFFIVFYPRFSLDKRYTNLGRVIDNMAAVDDINRGEPPQDPTRILQASLASDNAAPPIMTSTPAPEEEITADILNAPLNEQ
ncbi:MAG: peptidylprolyl isomerase [Erythrobacter sp.]|jgi:peptidylprolyl isomerase|nr:peptidylprolyl isomerase [Erythrobacter sp.]